MVCHASRPQAAKRRKPAVAVHGCGQRHSKCYARICRKSPSQGTAGLYWPPRLAPFDWHTLVKGIGITQPFTLVCQLPWSCAAAHASCHQAFGLVTPTLVSMFIYVCLQVARGRPRGRLPPLGLHLNTMAGYLPAGMCMTCLSHCIVR